MKAAAVTIGLFAAMTGGAVGLAGPANADVECVGGYPPASCGLTISDSRVIVGQTLTYRGTDYAPGEKATATVFSKPVLVDTTTVSRSGVARGNFKVPQLAPGQHTLKVLGLTSGVERSATFTVVAKGAAGHASAKPDSLAYTGSDGAKTAGAGALLLLSGGALMMAGKRRKRVNAAII